MWHEAIACGRMRPIDDLLRPWLDQLRADAGGLDIFDAHTHVGRNDPDGNKQKPEELLERLARCDARALVFPMHEPDGYAAANDEVVAAAAAAAGSRGGGHGRRRQEHPLDGLHAWPFGERVGSPWGQH